MIIFKTYFTVFDITFIRWYKLSKKLQCNLTPSTNNWNFHKCMKTSIIVVSSMKSKSRMELNALNSLILYMCLTKSPENQSLYQRFFIVSIQCLLYVGTVGAIPLLIHISIGPQICKLWEILQIKVLLIYKSKWAQDIVLWKIAQAGPKI